MEEDNREKTPPFWILLSAVGCWHYVTTRSKVAFCGAIGALDGFTAANQKGLVARESSYLSRHGTTRWDQQRLQTALMASPVAAKGHE